MERSILWTLCDYSSLVFFVLAITMLAVFLGNYRYTKLYRGFNSVPLNYTQNGTLVTHAVLNFTVDHSKECQPNDVCDIQDLLASTVYSPALFEEFIIYHSYVKVTVNHGSTRSGFSLIHDWFYNFSAIVDFHRCYMKAIDSQVMKQEELLDAIDNHKSFNIRRYPVPMIAVLPAKKYYYDDTPLPTNLPSYMTEGECLSKRLYVLIPDRNYEGRDFDSDKKPDYRHFSGKGVQEIYINNLHQITNYEENVSAFSSFFNN